MTKITFYQNSAGTYVGFQASDHAGYAEAGEDIVCAGVSALVIHTVNAIDKYGRNQIVVNADEESALISLRVTDEPSQTTKILIEALADSIIDLSSDEQNQDFIDLIFEEV